MQVTQVNSPQFKAIHAQISKMNSAEKRMVEQMVDIITYSETYANAGKKGLDVCFFRPKKGLSTKFLKDKTRFIKDKNKKILEVNAGQRPSIEEYTRKILDKIEQINDGKFEAYNPVRKTGTRPSFEFIKKYLKDGEVDFFNL